VTGSVARLPSLGPRGEGWVVGQFLLMALVAVLGVRNRRPWLVRSPLDLAGLLSGTLLLADGATLAARGARDLAGSLTVLPHPRDEAELVETGAYARIRHPLYASAMLMAIGWATATRSGPALAASAVLAVWLDAKARLEEAWLIEQFAAYRAYRDRTSRFVPGIY
jgi:protein-S-isoprenylcysteine O-methyltransferase Ste14